MYLSDVFKFTQGLGQKGHQIGRKVGDAIELLTLGVIHLDEELTKHLVLEDGVEGATSAKHKVEFSFYHLDENLLPSKISEELFGIIECKKVGVEQTIKQNFKDWKSVPANKQPFYLTNGYSFSISPNNSEIKWSIKIYGDFQDNNNIKILVEKCKGGQVTESSVKYYSCLSKQQLLIATDIHNEIYLLGSGEKLSQIENHISKCIIIEIKHVDTSNKVIEINVNESLPGPQTPEKAKQASFVSLDVRKKVLGRFDKSDDDSFISVLVIGEASHWEKKSRSMVRLCNDFNLVVPDNILIHLFNKFEERFGDNYQENITKTKYRGHPEIRSLIFEIIQDFEKKILFDMDHNSFVIFKHEFENGLNKLKVVTLEDQ